jgi:hypothetical protein
MRRRYAAPESKVYVKAFNQFIRSDRRSTRDDAAMDHNGGRAKVMPNLAIDGEGTRTRTLNLTVLQRHALELRH